jgi:3-carboxy-cis,cis-muconate cycloisomerase
LSLGVAEVPVWQVHRDAMARLAGALGAVVGVVAKIANDVALMGQAEVGELWEAAAPGRGTSSAMPHKRNPVGCLVARAAHLRAPARVAAVMACMAQEFERGLGSWQAELPELAELFALAGGAGQAMAQALDGATVDSARMRRNIDALADLPQAEALTQLWAPFMGRDGAHAQVEAWCRAAVASGTTLGTLALATIEAQATVGPTTEAIRAALDVDARAQRLHALLSPQWRWAPLEPLS